MHVLALSVKPYTCTPAIYSCDYSKASNYMRKVLSMSAYSYVGRLFSWVQVITGQYD